MEARHRSAFVTRFDGHRFLACVGDTSAASRRDFHHRRVGLRSIAGSVVHVYALYGE